jgi:hypothetical protein
MVTRERMSRIRAELDDGSTAAQIKVRQPSQRQAKDEVRDSMQARSREADSTVQLK